jgi:hypothetical protein
MLVSCGEWRWRSGVQTHPSNVYQATSSDRIASVDIYDRPAHLPSALIDIAPRIRG